MDAETWDVIRMQVWDSTHGYCQCARVEHQHRHDSCLNPITKGRFKLVVQPLGNTMDFSPWNLWGVCNECFKATPLLWRVSESPKRSR